MVRGNKFPSMLNRLHNLYVFFPNFQLPMVALDHSSQELLKDSPKDFLKELFQDFLKKLLQNSHNELLESFEVKLLEDSQK